MRSRHLDSLTHDAVHGYLPFTAAEENSDEIAERDLVDHPWVQRLRHIRQLQTAWWVFPTAEHTRFQHVLGAMHLAGRAAEALYPSLREVYPDTPSCAYVTSLLRMAHCCMTSDTAPSVISSSSSNRVIEFFIDSNLLPMCSLI